MKSTIVKPLTLLFFLATVAAACGGNSSGGASPAGGGGTPESSAPQSTPTGEASSGEISVEMDDFYFEPKTITGDAGQKVTVELENEGQATHTFTIDEQGVDVEVEPGEDGKATVTIPDSGSVQFYCRFHKSMGMTGTLRAA